MQIYKSYCKTDSSKLIYFDLKQELINFFQNKNISVSITPSPVGTSPHRGEIKTNTYRCIWNIYLTSSINSPLTRGDVRLLTDRGVLVDNRISPDNCYKYCSFARIAMKRA